MATWDSADLLARCKRMSGVASNVSFPADADWYAWLTEAQADWYNVFAAMVPYVLIGAPTAMSTADSGATYTFASAITPLYVEVYDSATSGKPLRAGAFWDPTADYVWEGNKIRFPQSATKTFTNGPVARYVAPPDVIAAATAPTLVPAHARLLLVYRAVIAYCERGGHRDPTPFVQGESRFWLGDPLIGRPGLLTTLRTQNPMMGAAALTGYGELSGLSYLTTGGSYNPL